MMDRIQFITKYCSGKILDCGGFEGEVHEILKKKFPDVVSIDREEGADYQADLNKDKLPFRDREFDTIIAGEIIEHLVELPFFLRECKRVLKDDGILLITTPNADGLSSFFAGIIKRYNPYHVLMFNRGTLRRYMEQLGFECEMSWANSFDIHNYPFWTRPFKYLTFLYPPWRLHVCAVCRKSKK